MLSIKRPKRSDVVCETHRDVSCVFLWSGAIRLVDYDLSCSSKNILSSEQRGISVTMSIKISVLKRMGFD